MTGLAALWDDLGCVWFVGWERGYVAGEDGRQAKMKRQSTALLKFPVENLICYQGSGAALSIAPHPNSERIDAKRDAGQKTRGDSV